MSRNYTSQKDDKSVIRDDLKNKRPFVILRDERKNPQQLTLMQLLTTTARIAPEKRKYVATQAPPINKHTFVQKEFNRFN